MPTIPLYNGLLALIKVEGQVLTYAIAEIIVNYSMVYEKLFPNVWNYLNTNSSPARRYCEVLQSAKSMVSINMDENNYFFFLLHELLSNKVMS